MSFTGRLVLGTLAVVVCTVLVLIWGAQRTMRNSLEEDTADALMREARLVRSLLPEDSSRWKPIIERVSAENGHRIVIRDRQGAVLAASDTLAAGEVMRREIAGGPGTIMVSAYLEPVHAEVRRATRSMTAAAALALTVALLLAFIAGRAVAAPMVSLGAAANANAAGAQSRFPRSGIREIDNLVQALRAMHNELGERFEELQREKAGSTAIVNAMAEGIVAADARGRITIANPAARRLLGYSEGSALPELATLFRVKAAREAVEEVLLGHVVVERAIAMDGSSVTINARPLGDGGAVVLLRDVTEVKRLESIRRDFVANVSHELKTPLTSISGYAETLAAGGVDEESTRRFLDTIHSNARRMQALVDDLLDLSRIESGRWVPQREVIDLGRLAQESWAELAERAAARNVTFKVDIDPLAKTVEVDRNGLRSILVNLLDNALRYVPDGGHVEFVSRPERGGTLLMVRDNGGGIPAEHLDRIFERFYRVDPSRSREAGGTGLGLSIVRHTVEAHGGTVAAESMLRKGTTIRCWFPMPMGTG